jgi:hypothetical protein
MQPRPEESKLNQVSAIALKASQNALPGPASKKFSVTARDIAKLNRLVLSIELGKPDAKNYFSAEDYAKVFAAVVVATNNNFKELLEENYRGDDTLHISVKADSPGQDTIQVRDTFPGQTTVNAGVIRQENLVRYKDVPVPGSLRVHLTFNRNLLSPFLDKVPNFEMIRPAIVRCTCYPETRCPRYFPYCIGPDSPKSVSSRN